MKLKAHLVSALDLPAALTQLESQRGEFLPSSLASRAAASVAGDFLPRFATHMQTGVDLHPADVVFAHRYGSGTRPVPDLGIEARLVIEALAKRLGDELAEDAELLGLAPHIEPAQGQKMNFERGPLDGARPAFVAKADVASFYEYVDHELLGAEIVELTGDAELAAAIKGALSELMGRRFGLPQGPPGSDILASLYLSRVDRVLMRAGVRATRFNDDYLFKADSAAGGRRDVAALERALRDLGLILNHEKTQVMTVEQYEEGLSAYQELLQAAAIETVELPAGYTFDPDEFEGISLESADEEVIVAAFERAIDDAEHPFPARQRMIDTALPYLAGFQNLKPLQRLDVLVETWPAHIRNVNLYLRALIGTEHEEAAAQAVVDVLTKQPLALPWTHGWLVDVLARCSHAEGAFAGWLTESAVGSALPWFVRGRALIALAHTDEFLSQATVSEIYEAAPAPTRPDIAAAVQIAQAAWSEQFVSTFTARDVILRKVTEIVQSETLRAVL